MKLNGKHVVLGISGGIAAYKAAEVLRQLMQEGAEVHVVMSSHCRQVGTASVVAVVPGAAITGDTTIHLVVNQWAQVLVAVRVLTSPVMAIPVTYHYRHVLQMTLTTLGAYRAIVGVIEHQRFDNVLAKLLRLITAQGENRALGNRGHAAHHDTPAAAFF